MDLHSKTRQNKTVDIQVSQQRKYKNSSQKKLPTCYMKLMKGIIQKLRNAKLLEINIL